MSNLIQIRTSVTKEVFDELEKRAKEPRFRGAIPNVVHEAVVNFISPGLSVTAPVSEYETKNPLEDGEF